MDFIILAGNRTVLVVSLFHEAKLHFSNRSLFSFSLPFPNIAALQAQLTLSNATVGIPQKKSWPYGLCICVLISHSNNNAKLQTYEYDKSTYFGKVKQVSNRKQVDYSLSWFNVMVLYEKKI